MGLSNQGILYELLYLAELFVSDTFQMTILEKCSCIQMILLAFDLTPSMLQLIIHIVSLSGSGFHALIMDNLEVLSGGFVSENRDDLP